MESSLRPGDRPGDRHGDWPVEEPMAAAGDDLDAGLEGVEGLEVDLLTLASIEAELDEVERALVRLDDGTYGRCEVCDTPLDEAELVDVPMARHCRDHRSTAPA